MAGFDLFGHLRKISISALDVLEGPSYRQRHDRHLRGPLAVLRLAAAIALW
jgi:hypothetical protein